MILRRLVHWGRVRTTEVSRRRCSSLTPPRLPSSARVVIVGGGIIGNSVAYHLAKFGWTDVVVLERHQLTSGTTWHAAGLMVTFGSLNETSVALRKYTKQLYQALEEETGQATGFKPCGFIQLATDRDYLHEFQRVAVLNRHLGVDVHELTAAEVKELCPLCETSDVLAGFYVPTDGRVNPVDVTTALYKGAKQRGVKYYQGITCTGVQEKNGRVAAVRTTEGDIAAEFVINCAGMWARQLGEINHITIPNQAAEHYYLITEPIDGLDPNAPVLEDPKSHTYIRPESNGGLMIGMFEPKGAVWNEAHIPDDFAFGEIHPDWDRMTPYLETAMKRVPASLSVGTRTLFCGPESFTPDLGPVIGEAPEMRNYFVAAGLNSIGILSGGGIGKIVAEWVVHGKPDVDVTSLDICRFEPYQRTRAYRKARVEEALGMVYKCHYPTLQASTAREVKFSPIHEELYKAGAVFKNVSGFESPEYFANPADQNDLPRYTWGRDSSFNSWEREHLSCRNDSVLFDMSFMSKFQIVGDEAGEVLDYICTAKVDADDDRITYTQCLSDTGKILADVTVIKHRSHETSYTVIATDTMRRNVQNLLQRAVVGKKAYVFDATGGLAMFSIQGPSSAIVLQRATPCNISELGFRDCKSIEIGCAQVICSRITYVGELGFELLVPTEFAKHVYGVLTTEPITHAGLRALNSLRLEKGYKDYGHDLDNTDEIRQAGLSFTCDLSKEFRGKAAVLEQRKKPMFSRLVNFQLLDPQPFVFHGEVLYRNETACGIVRSGSYGFTLGGAVGIACVQCDEAITQSFIKEGNWSVDIAANRIPIHVSTLPLYDPRNTRVR